ncbi:18503_t:CDS:2 [Acaulospora morrowiae]|uniref:18503_t:CDS:1 n=1 Tax=Acaulospora morrowiae TaxID=94023 RepID=A0A9N8WJ03_9GLOM|nr:18503_t:CDS:2 [Acaulospora morrowiae]
MGNSMHTEEEKAVNPYILFYQEYRESEDPDGRRITSEVAAFWNSMSGNSRQPYFDKAKQLRGNAKHVITRKRSCRRKGLQYKNYSSEDYSLQQYTKISKIY